MLAFRHAAQLRTQTKVAAHPPRKDPCFFEPGQSLRHFAGKLLSSQYVEVSGEWASTSSVTTPVDLESCSSRELPCAPCFESHLAIGVADHQLGKRAPATTPGAITTTEVHRFRLNGSIAADINKSLRDEGAALHAEFAGGKLCGVRRSNVRGFHTEEVEFGGSSSEWYGKLHNVLLEALRTLRKDGEETCSEACGAGPDVSGDGEGCGGSGGSGGDGGGSGDGDDGSNSGWCEAVGSSAQGRAGPHAARGASMEWTSVASTRVTGWMNVSGKHDFNSLHDHGVAEWAAVYYVDPGSGAAAPTPTASRDDAGKLESSLAGSMLLKFQPQAWMHEYSFLTIPPLAGDLWVFPGHVPHAVLPHALPSNSEQSGGELLEQTSAGASMQPAAEATPERLRISVACNIHRSAEPGEAEDRIVRRLLGEARLEDAHRVAPTPARGCDVDGDADTRAVDELLGGQSLLDVRIAHQCDDAILCGDWSVVETASQTEWRVAAARLEWTHRLRALALLPAVGRSGPVPAQILVTQGDLNCLVEEPAAAAAFFARTGICVFEASIPSVFIDACRLTVEGISSRIDAALVRHGLGANVILGNGDFAFNEVVRRGRGRLDVRGLGMHAPPLDDDQLHGTAPWQPFVRAVLGDGAHECFRGIMDNRPGSATQPWHADGSEKMGYPDAYEEPGVITPARCITVFVPLVDTMDHACGPTQFFPGSHDQALKETYHNLADEDHPDQLPFTTPTLRKGGSIAFDYRLVHRGTRNSRSITEGESRPVLYIVYAAEGCTDEHNFPTNSPLFDFDTERARLFASRTALPPRSLD